MKTNTKQKYDRKKYPQVISDQEAIEIIEQNIANTKKLVIKKIQEGNYNLVVEQIYFLQEQETELTKLIWGL